MEPTQHTCAGRRAMQALKSITRLLMLAVLAALACMPCANAYGTLSLTGDSDQGCTLHIRSVMYSYAEVLHEASAEEQALFAQDLGGFSGSRQLLHGSHSRRSMRTCPICTFPRSCSRSKSCKGHCRRGEKIFSCIRARSPPKRKSPPKPRSPPKRKSRPSPPPKTKASSRARASSSGGKSSSSASASAKASTMTT